LEIAGVISKDGVFLQPVETHDCAAVDQMSLEIFISKAFNGISEDEESNNFNVELCHFYDVECQDFVGDLFLRAFGAVNGFGSFSNANGTEYSESFFNFINGSKVFGRLGS